MSAPDMVAMAAAMAAIPSLAAAVPSPASPLGKDGMVVDMMDPKVDQEDSDESDESEDVDADDASTPSLQHPSAGEALAPFLQRTPAEGGKPYRAKTRQSLTLEQRRLLRIWVNSQAVRPSHRACIEWFRTQFGQNISQSTVSHSLSPKYTRLDSEANVEGSRMRMGNWPDVEKLVLLWFRQMMVTEHTPTNEELADKARNIFQQLPRYRADEPPEFSPGWIHRFKKRYGLLSRRHRRRHGTLVNPADDMDYLVDAVPRFMPVSPDTPPTLMRDNVLRVVGVEPSLVMCARVRDEIVRRVRAPPANGLAYPNTTNFGLSQQQTQPPQPPPPQPQPQPQPQQKMPHTPQQYQAAVPDTTPFSPLDANQDPEVVLQNAMAAMQAEEDEAEVEASRFRPEASPERVVSDVAPLVHLDNTNLGQAYAQSAGLTRQPYVQQLGGSAVSTHTPTRGGMQSHTRAAHQQLQSAPGADTDGGSGGGSGRSSNGAGRDRELNLAPVTTVGGVASHDQPLRCPFCINQRMLRTIKEAVEHLSTHVVV